MSKNTLVLGTRKGLVTYRKQADGSWAYDDTHFLGIPVSIATYDSLNSIWWAFLDHGHWGCKIHKSSDGKHWEELEAPKYPEGEEIKEGVPAVTKYLWAFSNGGANGHGKIYVGTEPGGLFKSEDSGKHFELVRGLWDHPSRKDGWFGGGRDHPGIHSVLVDPDDADHIFVGISCAGVFETEDGGTSWKPRNKGLNADFLPDPHAEVGQDPHLVVMSKGDKQVMWQQNHCGIFRTTDGAKNWEEVSQKDGPANFGFAIAVHDQKPEVAWVVPGVSDEIRVAVDRSLCVCRTEDGGKTWRDFRRGLPQSATFDIVFRHALDVSGDTLAFGTTTGNLYLSNDGGEDWQSLNVNLPMIYSLEFAEV